jgi:uncharacterized membrane protein YkvA (DUF1232 family)
MATWNRAEELRRAAFSKEIVGYRLKEWERKVRRDFWPMLKHLAGQLPFVEDLIAAYYCALDPETPMRVRGILLATLAYFILRWRSRPLTWLRRFPGLGFTDDAAVLTAVFGLSSHITPVHRAAAARTLGKELSVPLN